MVYLCMTDGQTYGQAEESHNADFESSQYVELRLKYSFVSNKQHRKL